MINPLSGTVGTGRGESLLARVLGWHRRLPQRDFSYVASRR